MVELTAAHWVYALFIVLILITMALRRETPLVCIIGSFILSWVITGSLIQAVQAIFNSITVASSVARKVTTASNASALRVSISTRRPLRSRRGEPNRYKRNESILIL